ncbi:hypothetical protein [Streptomyces sp. CC219B]|uniref:hypothetical protein n=1 Tax=Streptomyces sp. CC219B TaxID=3044574 RepID=UPI0024A80AEE|nr:hypothetical protein [Streptomyces sp. CC219B]
MHGGRDAESGTASPAQLGDGDGHRVVVDDDTDPVDQNADVLHDPRTLALGLQQTQGRRPETDGALSAAA